MTSELKKNWRSTRSNIYCQGTTPQIYFYLYLNYFVAFLNLLNGVQFSDRNWCSHLEDCYDNIDKQHNEK